MDISIFYQFGQITQIGAVTGTLAIFILCFIGSTVQAHMKARHIVK